MSQALSRACVEAIYFYFFEGSSKVTGRYPFIKGGGSNSALVRLGRGHKFFSKSIAVTHRSVILCNYDA